MRRDEELFASFCKVTAWDFFFPDFECLFLNHMRVTASLQALGLCESRFLPSSVAAPVLVSSEGLLAGLWCRRASSCTVLYTQ